MGDPVGTAVSDDVVSSSMPPAFKVRRYHRRMPDMPPERQIGLAAR
jgi:hypothetical protein